MATKYRGFPIATDNAKDIPTFLYQKLWEIYLLTNQKRVKSFFYLIFAIIFLLLVISDGVWKVTFLGTKINVETAINILPIVIFFLSLRYFVLSALSFGNHNKFNAYLNAYISAINLRGTPWAKSKFEELKSDDVNEFPNMFLIPLQINKSNKIIMPDSIKILLDGLMTFVLMFFHCSAIWLYLYLILCTKEYKGSIPLIVLGLLLSIAIIYFLFGTNKALKEFKSRS